MRTLRVAPMEHGVTSKTNNACRLSRRRGRGCGLQSLPLLSWHLSGRWPAHTLCRVHPGSIAAKIGRAHV